MNYILLRFSRVKSTQTLAKKIISNTSKNKIEFKLPVVIIAKEQINSYGRLKRKWYSPKGGLWFSIIIQEKKSKYSKIPGLITKITRIVQSAIIKTYHIEPTIKLPNDLVYSGKKLAGCLAETVNVNKMLYIIIGIGINANNPIPKKLQNSAISLKQILKRKANLDKLLNSILDKIENLWMK